MNEIDVLKKENEDLRRECEILQKILLDERRFFIQEFKHSVVENYRQTVQNNREHKKGVTELAKKTGISYNTLMNIGKRDLSFGRMVKIADILDVSLDEFRKDNT